MSPVYRVCVVVGAIICLGCETEVDRLDAEFGEAAREKLMTVDAVLEGLADKAEVGTGYAELVAAREQLEQARSFADSDSLDEPTRELFRKQISEKAQQVEELLSAIAIDDSHRLSFAAGNSQNAATILLTEDGTTSPVKDFRDRNDVSAAWYLSGPSASNAEDVAKRYRRLTELEYLLVIRQLDIAIPEHEGQDDHEHEVYSLGAIECDAFLFSLSDGEIIGSFRFIAPNQQSPIAFAGFDPFLSGDPEIGVSTLTGRLFQTAHDYATAVAAELSETIESEYEIKRDLLGHRLEQI